MKQALAPIQTASVAPRPMPQALDLALSSAFNAIECGSLPAAALPSGARVALESRARVLDAALTPAPREAVLYVLASLAGMPTKTESDPAKLKAILSVEVSDLMASGLPVWALEAAARAYRLGLVGHWHWRPTAGDLASNARTRVLAHQIERDRIAKVLRAKIELPRKPASPEQRREVADRIRSMFQTERVSS